MNVISGTNRIIKKVVLVVLVTVIPVLLVVQLWQVIIIYWLLIMSFFLFGTGGIFIFCYFKSYDPKLIILKIKKRLAQKWGVTISLDEELKPPAAQEMKGFLVAGVILNILGMYLFTQFVKTN